MPRSARCCTRDQQLIGDVSTSARSLHRSGQGTHGIIAMLDSTHGGIRPVHVARPPLYNLKKA
jgi:hypothetical protein